MRGRAPHRIAEWWIEATIRCSGVICIGVVGLIFVFLLKEGLPIFRMVSIGSFLLGRHWHPISEPPAFGILPLLAGSLWVTVGAATLALPMGVGCALFIAEVAPARLRELLKTLVELLAAIPSVVMGFVGMLFVAPLVQRWFHLPTGLTAFSASLMLALMAMPTVVSLAEDAIRSVPRSYRDGALALGASRWQAIYRVVLPAASPGIVAAMMLGIGRVIGETMAVVMITGNAARFPRSVFEPVRTLTATIVSEMGETVQGGEHYAALFAIGLVLFALSFTVNLVADFCIHRG